MALSFPRNVRSTASTQPGGAPIASFEAEIGALAGLPDGGAAVGLIDGRIVFVGGWHGGKTIAAHPEVKCITALTPARDGALLVANGSATNGPIDWKRDLMEKNASGSLWRLDPASGAFTRLAGGSRLSLWPPRGGWRRSSFQRAGAVR